MSESLREMEFYTSKNSYLFGAAISLLGAVAFVFIKSYFLSVLLLTPSILAFIGFRFSKSPLIFLSKNGIKYRSVFSRKYNFIEWNDVGSVKFENSGSTKSVTTLFVLHMNNYEIIPIDISSLSVGKNVFAQYVREFSPFIFV